MEEFEKLMGKYWSLVFRFLLAQCGNEELAEELTAETFYQAYLHIGSFRGDCQVQTWLCRIARNALIREQKRRNRHLPWHTVSQENPTELFQQFSDREQVLQIYKFLHRLKEPYKEVFTLRVLGELSFREIGTVCEKTESWAKVTFYRAKEKLMSEMEGYNEDRM